MWTLTPWQTLLWIAAVELISLPLIAGFVRTIIDGYFKAKEEHIGRVFNSLGKAIEQIGKEAKERSDKMKTDIFELLSKKLEEDEDENS